MKHDRLVRPSRRQRRASIKPSHIGPSFPLSDYIIPARDSLGASSRVSVTVQPTVLRISKMILSTGGLPFETPDDVLRWAVYHGLMRLVELTKDNDVKGAFSEMKMWTDVAGKEETELYFAKHLKKIFGVIEKLETSGHDPKAVAMAEMVWRGSDKVEDPYWRKVFRDEAKKALDTMKRRNGHGA